VVEDQAQLRRATVYTLEHAGTPCCPRRTGWKRSPPAPPPRTDPFGLSDLVNGPAGRTRPVSNLIARTGADGLPLYSGYAGAGRGEEALDPALPFLRSRGRAPTWACVRQVLDGVKPPLES